ncbi:MAG: hypothetical protein ABEI13_00110 [Candidatus Paceibacteria bacterium]
MYRKLKKEEPHISDVYHKMCADVITYYYTEGHSVKYGYFMYSMREHLAIEELKTTRWQNAPKTDVIPMLTDIIYSPVNKAIAQMRRYKNCSQDPPEDELAAQILL